MISIDCTCHSVAMRAQCGLYGLWLLFLSLRYTIVLLQQVPTEYKASSVDPRFEILTQCSTSHVDDVREFLNNNCYHYISPDPHNSSVRNRHGSWGTVSWEVASNQVTDEMQTRGPWDSVYLTCALGMIIFAFRTVITWDYLCKATLWWLAHSNGR